MKRRSSAGGKPARSRRLDESSKSKARSSPKALSSSLSHNGAESEVVQLREELHEAREQQTATAEVLGVISRSKFELQPVLQSVVDTALRLCRAEQAVIYRPENGVYRFAAGHSLVPDYMEIEMKTEIRPGSGTAVGRAVLTRKVARIDDALADPHYEKKADARVGGVRSMIGVPLIREGEPIGAIALARNRVEPFTDREIELVKSFAAQAVIAIENARLLNALRESLQQQTATSEVFQVVSSSPGDLEPVFATMLEKAVRICDAKFGNIYRWDGNALHLASSYNTPPAFAEARGRSPHLPAEHSSDALTSVPGRMATTNTNPHIEQPMVAQSRRAMDMIFQG
jgi:putative methionine-R-sulfoxide reductase with GAF domain